MVSTGHDHAIKTKIFEPIQLAFNIHSLSRVQEIMKLNGHLTASPQGRVVRGVDQGNFSAFNIDFEKIDDLHIQLGKKASQGSAGHLLALGDIKARRSL